MDFLVQEPTKEQQLAKSHSLENINKEIDDWKKAREQYKKEALKFIKEYRDAKEKIEFWERVKKVKENA